MKGAKKIILSLIIVSLVVIISAVWLKVYMPVRKFLAEEKQKIKATRTIGSQILSSDTLDKVSFPSWDIITTCRSVTGLEQFDGRYFAATEGGLKTFSFDGTPEKVYSNLHGLIENNLTCLAKYKGKLFIGTRNRGLMSIYEDGLTNYSIEKKACSKITALETDGEFLFIGTYGGGVIKFDGQEFSNEVNLLKGADFKNVTALAVENGRLVVGTFNNGVFRSQNGAFTHLTRKEGLASNDIRALSIKDDMIYIGTPFGVDVIDKFLRIKPLIGDRFVTAIVFYRDAMVLGTFNQGVYFLHKMGEQNFLRGIGINSLKIENNCLWGLTREGIYKFEGEQWLPFYQPDQRETELSSNHLTSLAFDKTGKLWIGTFEDGINLLSCAGKIIQKICDEECRIINCLSYNNGTNQMFVGTSRGVLIYEETNRRHQFAMEDGLIGNNVSDIKFSKEEAMFCTNKGVSFYEKGRFKSLYVFHGLVNNHVYTSEIFDGKIFLGTLGGISVLNDKRVVKNLTAANSNLSANWIAVLKRAGEQLFIGTYGGGIDALNNRGEWANFSLGVGKVEINCNAVLYCEPWLLFGTLDKGIMACNLSTREWRNITKGIPSVNITAFAADDKYIYVATDNGLGKLDKNYLKTEFSIGS